MLPLYPDLLDAGSPPIREGYRRVAYLAHGWFLRCQRGVEAILLLADAGYAEEASPIRRSIIEHTVALKWLAAEGDKIVDTLARGHAWDAKRRHDAVAAASWTSINLDEITAIITEIDTDARNPANDHLLQFKQRLDNYGDVHELPGYLAECSRTHPGYQSAVCYVDPRDGAPLVTSRDQVWQVPFATTQLLKALLAIRTVFNPPPWEEGLSDILSQYQTVINDVRKQDGLAPIDWTTNQQ